MERNSNTIYFPNKCLETHVGTDDLLHIGKNKENIINNEPNRKTSSENLECIYAVNLQGDISNVSLDDDNVEANHYENVLINDKFGTFNIELSKEKNPRDSREADRDELMPGCILGNAGTIDCTKRKQNLDESPTDVPSDFRKKTRLQKTESNAGVGVNEIKTTETNLEYEGAVACGKDEKACVGDTTKLEMPRCTCMTAEKQIDREDIDSIIKKVFTPLVDYMDSDTIIDTMMNRSMFRPSNLSDMTNEAKSQRNRDLLRFIMQRDSSAYTKLKVCLRETNQDLILTLLEEAEVDGNISEVIKEIEEEMKERHSPFNKLFRALKASISKLDWRKKKLICYAYVYIGREVCMAVFVKRVKDLKPSDIDPSTWTIDFFLNNRKSQIEAIIPKLSRTIMNIIFPTADLRLWDVPLICQLLINICDVKDLLRQGLEWMFEQRDKFAKCNNENFDRKFKKLKTYIYSFAHKTKDVDLTERITDQFKQLETGVLPNSTTAIITTTINRSVENLKDEIKTQHMDTRAENTKCYEELRAIVEKGNLNTIGIMETIIRNQEKILQQMQPGYSSTVPVTPVKINLLNTSLETELEISETVVKSLNFEGSRNDSGIGKASEEVRNLYKNEGYPIAQAEQGCVKLYIQCTSIVSLLTLLRDYMTGYLDALLEPLRKSASLIYGINDLKLETLMYEDDFNSILSLLDTMARADEQTHGPHHIVDSDVDSSTGRNPEETDTSLSALDKVYTVLVDCMIPDPVLDSLLEIGFHQTLIRDIREERSTSDKNRKLIEAVRKGRYEAYAKFKSSLMQCGQKLICSLLDRAEKWENTSDLQEELREKARIQMKPESEDDKLCKDLKEDIITYYREHVSVIPASPLVDEHYVPIEDLYVLPPMWAYKNPYFYPSKNIQKGDETSGNDGQDEQKITISGLFFSGDVRYKKIYITANAGFGKTSLSQKLTMTWCQSQSTLESLAENSEEAVLDCDLDSLKYFDLLFLLHLREYQCESKCNLDDLIIKMVSDKLSRNTLYTKEFLQRCLHERKCLVILDGLDEWAHPGHCTRKPEVPHNNHPDTCTVLTTTRDWKIGTIGLSPKDIDRRVEISLLDNETRKLLEKNAICILNERNLNLVGKNTADFDKKVQTFQFGDIIYNPYILLQLMCLFFDGLPIGKSKCEIYSNIIEFTLERGMKKRSLPDIHVQRNDNAPVSNCMNENETCKRYFMLLMKLGKLAFYTLFSRKRESSLIFDRRIVTQYMTEQEIEFCLKAGLLCQTKDSSIIAVKRYQVFYQHKSVQEFFSAIYITSEWQNVSVKSTILNVCSSLSGILEMSNVFVFVCGMNPEVYTCISFELQTIVDLDDVTRRCMTDMYTYDDAETLRSYQSMQIECLQESMRNGNESCPIYLYVVLDRHMYPPVDLSTLKTVIHFNKGHVKSLLLFKPDDKIIAFMQSLDPGVFTSLESRTL